MCVTTCHFANADKLPMRSGWPSYDQEISFLLVDLSNCCSIPSSVVVFLEFWCFDSTAVRGYNKKTASDSLRAGRSRDRIPVEARYSALVLTGPGSHPRLLYNGYRGINGCKAAVAWRWPPTTSIADIKERGELPLLLFFFCTTASRSAMRDK